MVARYDFYAKAEGMGEADLIKDENKYGGYVEWDDYQAIVEELENLKGKIVDLYREI